MTHQVEPMRWWDIEQVAALEQQLFPTDSPWTAAMFWAELADPDTRRYVVVRDGERVVGYAGIGLPPGQNDPAEVLTIGVDPRGQRQGLGRSLLRALLDLAEGRRVLLDVRTDNAPAKALYESFGFTRIGVRRRYYQPSGADADTMQRSATEHPATSATAIAERTALDAAKAHR